MKKLTTPHLLVGTAANCPDIRYATSFDAPDDVYVLVLPETTFLIVSDMEYGRAIEQAQRCEVECPSSLNRLPDKRHYFLPSLFFLLEKFEITSLEVAERFPVGIVKELEKHRITIDVVPASPFSEKRAVKRPDEISHIAKTQKAAQAAMKAVEKAIRDAVPGKDGILYLDSEPLTSERAKEIIRSVVLANNCIDEGTIVAGGAQGANPHEAGSGPLKEGEWIVCDIFPRDLTTGYWGDMTRTFMNGKPSSEQKRMYKAVHDAQKKALATIRNGIFGSTVHKATSKALEKAGFETFIDDKGIPQGFIHSTGHGVGLEIHEEPRLSISGGRLKTGMVVSVEPGLYYSELGGVRIEDLVVVSADGVTVL